MGRGTFVAALFILVAMSCSSGDELVSTAGPSSQPNNLALTDETRRQTTTTKAVTTTTAVPTTAATTAPVPQTPVVDAGGYGRIRIGMLLKDAQAAGLVGPAERPACEFLGPDPIATLKPPLEGYVLSSTSDGKIIQVTATGNFVTKPGDLKKGATLTQFIAAFTAGGYKPTVDKSSEETLEFWTISVLTNQGAEAFRTTVDPVAQKIDNISVPSQLFCE